MTNDNALVMPHDLPRHVHRALKAWHKRHKKSMLDDFLCAYEVRTAQQIQNVHLVINQILIEGLDRLKNINAEAARLLQRRFLNQETAREIAYSLNTTQDAIYQKQRAAIEQLAQVIWHREREIRQERAHRVESRLPPPTYTKLFGVGDKVAEISARLKENTNPWLLALEGMGGIGKTSLAHALARELAYDLHFRDIAWISARQRLFRLSGTIDNLTPVPSLTFEALVDQLIEQFELAPLKRSSSREKIAGVREYLKEHPCLIIVDNLETLTDYRALVIRLRDLVNPSKILITTRYSLRGETGVYILQLDGLSSEDTLALIRYEAAGQGLSELADAPDASLHAIYEVTQGNPLATKLVVGQIHTFPLPVVLQRLRGARGEPTTELLDFIHLDAWQSLDERCRRTLKALLLVSDCGGQIEQIAAASGLSISETAMSLQYLVTHALVATKGGLNERLYALHQLTHNFVRQRMSKE